MGPALTGKTNVAIEFPKPYFIDLDKKLTNAVQRHPTKEFWYDYVDVDDKGKPIQEALRYKRLIQLMKKAVVNPEIETIVIDGLSQVGICLMDHILADEKNPTLIGGVQVPTLKHWQPFGILLTKLIMLGRASEKKFICVAHTGTEKDENTGISMEVPLVQSNTRYKLASMFTDVWNTSAKVRGGKPEYKVRTQPKANLALVSSVPGIPAEFEFTWDEYQKHMRAAGS